MYQDVEVFSTENAKAPYYSVNIYSNLFEEAEGNLNLGCLVDSISTIIHWQGLVRV